MAKFPQLSGKEVVCIFQFFGWKVARQRGSHIILVKYDHAATLAVPNHKEVAQGTLRGLMRAAGLSAKDIFDVLTK